MRLKIASETLTDAEVGVGTSGEKNCIFSPFKFVFFKVGGNTSGDRNCIFLVSNLYFSFQNTEAGGSTSGQKNCIFSRFKFAFFTFQMSSLLLCTEPGNIREA